MTKHHNFSVFLMLAGAFFSFYMVFGLQIAAGSFFDYYNLAFDMDPRRYAEVIAQHEELRHPSSLAGGPKHPLLHLMQVIGKPLTWITGDWKLAAAATSCLLGALSVSMVFLFFRFLGVVTSLSVAGAGLFGVSAAPLINAFLSDSYVYALSTIILAWTIAAYRLGAPNKARVLAVLAAVASFGVTVTNVFQNALGEAAARKPATTWRALTPQLIRFGISVGFVALVVLIAAFPKGMLWIATHPIEALKVVYWQQTKGETTGIAHVLTSFFVYGFTAPQFTTVSLPGGAPMLDFRAWLYNGPIAWGSILGWAALLTLSAVCALRDRSSRKWIYLGLLLAIGVNLFLHGRYQFRGSVYLYAPHIIFNIFGFTAAGLLSASQLKNAARTATLAALYLLIIVTSAVNIPRAWEVSSAFETFEAKEEWYSALEARQIEP